MTESQWLACQTRPVPLLNQVRHKVSPRKLQLIAAKACRLVIDSSREQVLQRGVDALEGYAEGFVSDAEFVAARKEVDRTAEGFEDVPEEIGVSALAEAMSTEPYLGTVLYFVVDLSSRRAPPGQKRAAQQAIKRAICGVMHEIIGNPFRPFTPVPTWQGGGVVQPDGRTVMFTDSVKGIADAVYVTGDFGRLPILADALEEAGVTDEALLAHCRDGGPHLRGCWALDVVRGRA